MTGCWDAAVNKKKRHVFIAVMADEITEAASSWLCLLSCVAGCGKSILNQGKVQGVLGNAVLRFPASTRRLARGGGTVLSDKLSARSVPTVCCRGQASALAGSAFFIET